MFDRSIHELENAFLRQPLKGGVAPSRNQLIRQQIRLKRLATVEAEDSERRRRKAQARRDASIAAIGRLVRAILGVLNASHPHRGRVFK